MAVDGSLGGVILPCMLEDALECPNLVGHILGRAIEAGGVITPADVRDRNGPSCVPLYEYLERPGAVERILDLDRRTFEEMGHDFSSQPWTEENFRRELPGKAEVSFVAECEGEFIGFFIASERVPGEAHGHRIVLEPKWRTGRMAFQLWCAYWRVAAAQPEIRLLTGEVGTANRRMRRFLGMLGFRPLDAEETRDYLSRRDRDERLDGAEIISDQGARSIAMVLQIRPKAAASAR
jgi:ribosomal protein S18 acetylase RimI-like enzyme